MSEKLYLPSFEGEIELIEERIAYKGFLSVKELDLRHSLFSGGWSSTIRREVVLSTRVVGVLLFDPIADSVLLVEQFRPGLYATGETAWMTEIVAGRVDKNETLEKAAFREVFEETGCEVETLLPIADYYPLAGGCSEKVKLYCGLFSSEGSDGRLCGMSSENEDIRTRLISAVKMFKALAEGEVNNAASIIALQWLQMNHTHLVSKGFGL